MVSLANMMRLILTIYCTFDGVLSLNHSREATELQE